MNHIQSSFFNLADDVRPQKLFTIYYLKWNVPYLSQTFEQYDSVTWIYSTPPFLHLISSPSCLTLFQTGVLELQFSYAIHIPAEEEGILSPFILLTKQYYSTLLMLGILLALSSLISTCTVTVSMKSGE